MTETPAQPSRYHQGECLSELALIRRVVDKEIRKERLAALRGFEEAIEWLPNVKTKDRYGLNPFLEREYQESMRTEPTRRLEGT